MASVGVIGPNADSVVLPGGQLHAGTSSRYVTYLEGIRKACEGKARVFYSQGCHLYKNRYQRSGAARRPASPRPLPSPNAATFRILCLGTGRHVGGRGRRYVSNEYSSGDKKDLSLPQGPA